MCEAVRARGAYPLKLLIPRGAAFGPACWAYVVTYGGGLCGGDRAGLRVDVRHGAACVLATQASTKVYKRRPLPAALQAGGATGKHPSS
eukprot:3570832-Pyramimonas_sp.AAC.1